MNKTRPIKLKLKNNDYDKVVFQQYEDGSIMIDEDYLEEC